MDNNLQTHIEKYREISCEKKKWVNVSNVNWRERAWTRDELSSNKDNNDASSYLRLVIER